MSEGSQVDWSLTNDLQSGTITLREADGRSYARFFQDTSGPVYTDDEWDSLLCADERAPAYGLAKEMLAVDEQPSLAELSTLLYTADHHLFRFTQGIRNPPPIDYAGIVQGMNFVSDGGQVFHYQVWSFDSRGQRWNGEWFDRSLVDMHVGVNDDVGMYSQPMLVAVDSIRTYSFDILPRVKSLIVSSPVLNMDHVPAHWKVQGLYVGCVVNGAALLDAEFSNVDVRGFTSHAGFIPYLVDPGFTAKTLNVLSPIVTPVLKDVGTRREPSLWHIASYGISGHSVLQPGTNEHGFTRDRFTPYLTPDLLRDMLQRIAQLEDWRESTS